MKRLKVIFFILCLTVISFANVLAQGDGTPPPKSGRKAIPLDPPNEELPINDHIVLLVVLAVVLGIVIIYRNRIKKASI